MLLLIAGYGLAAILFYGYIYLTAGADPHPAALPQSGPPDAACFSGARPSLDG